MFPRIFTGLQRATAGLYRGRVCIVTNVQPERVNEGFLVLFRLWQLPTPPWPSHTTSPYQ